MVYLLFNTPKLTDSAMVQFPERDIQPNVAHISTFVRIAGARTLPVIQDRMALYFGGASWYAQSIIIKDYEGILFLLATYNMDQQKWDILT